MLWSITNLGAQRIHPAFIYYLYLRKQSVRGQLAAASASAQEVQDLLRMPGGPEGRPYYRPLRERGDRRGELLRSFWLQDNLAGSWAPSSLKRIAPAAWMVDDQNRYVMPDNHVERARESLLFGQRISGAAMASYFLRNDGFLIEGSPHANDLITAFRKKFVFDPIHDDQFSQLFDETLPSGVNGQDLFSEVGTEPATLQHGNGSVE